MYVSKISTSILPSLEGSKREEESRVRRGESCTFIPILTFPHDNCVHVHVYMTLHGSRSVLISVAVVTNYHNYVSGI